MITSNLLSTLDDIELVGVYGLWLNELRNRKMIRTQNVVGELGEYIAIKHYSSTARLPTLQAALTSTQNIDAISRNGERYSIKATTTKTTGVFYGLNDPNDTRQEQQKFEYVIIVCFNKDYSIHKILELNWDLFIKHKRWHSRMRAWNLSINSSLLRDCKTVFSDK
jgi:hypothetical protein